MERDADILVAGGGLNGTTLALALASGGFSVTLVDPSPEAERRAEGFDGRGYALALASQRLLDALGIWQPVADRAQPIQEIKISDGRAGEAPSPFVLEFAGTEIEERPMGYMLEDRHLRRSLLDRLGETGNVTRITGASVTGQTVTEAGVEIRLSDGRTMDVALLAGADGKRSATAERAGLSRRGWRYGQTALVCAIEHERPHEGVAHQYFLPSGPLAILPLPGNRSSIVWTERDALARGIQGLDDEGFLAALRPRFGDFLGAISLAGHRFAYELELSLSESFIAPRLALVGDAAHALHPIAGQGLNAGLRDVAALAEVLVDARRRGEDFGRPEVLERYQRWRRFDTTALAVATDAFNRLFSNDSGLFRLGRDLGLGVVNALPGMRRTFIREAAGLTGDLPRLSRGLAL